MSILIVTTTVMTPVSATFSKTSTFCEAHCGRLFGSPEPAKPKCKETIYKKILRGGQFRTIPVTVKSCVQRNDAYKAEKEVWDRLAAERNPFGTSAR